MNKNQIQIVNESNANNTDMFRWTTEFSDLGVPPGCVPAQLATTLGNGQPFNFVGSEGGTDCMSSITCREMGAFR